MMTIPVIFEDVLKQIPLPLFVTDEKGIYTYCNEAFASFFGLPVGAVIGKNMSDLLSDSLAARLILLNQELVANQGSWQYDVELQDLTGQKRDFVVYKRVIALQSGSYNILGTMTDVTELKSLQRYQHRMFKFSEMLLRINQSITASDSIESLLKTIMMELHEAFEQKDCGCILINQNGRLKIAAHVGYAEDAVLDFDIAFEESYFWRYAKGDLDHVYRINQIDLIEQEDYSKVVTSLSGKEMISSLSAPIIIDGELFGLINFDAAVRDAFTSEQVDFMEYVRGQLAIAIKNMKLYEQTVYLSRHDRLTTLFNRHYFEAQISRLIKKARLESKSLILIAVDVDNLKKINDEMGHMVGDKVLVTVANALVDLLSEDAIVARFGGDEFIALAWNRSLAQIRMDLTVMRNQLLLTNYGTYPVSFSFGTTELEPEDTYSKLLKRADDAMYAEKRMRIADRRKSEQ